MALLEIENLTVSFGDFRAVDSASITIDQGQTLGIVGESGSGKSVSMLALMGLIAYPGEIRADKLIFDGQDLLSMPASKRRMITGRDVAMIFQEPMTSLNPCFTVGFQIMEALKIHQGGNRQSRKKRTVELFEQVGIPDPARRLNAFPHQLSGGMNQRVMMAMAIACNPKLLIADEPTTALDVTIQAQILDLLLSLQKETGMAMILITHDMGVIAETVNQVNVMYAGQIVEQQEVNRLFTQPSHPYTSALLEALPERSHGKRRLPTIPGVVPGPYDRPSGCLFNPRCQQVQQDCREQIPDLQAVNHGDTVRCFHPLSGSGNA
jgi:dipeptide transport system ATP-binding protein